MRKFLASLLAAALMLAASASVSWGSENAESEGGTWEMMEDVLGGTWE